jgi:chemotaxis protein CheZ
MAARRKVFRIEEMAASQLPEATADGHAPQRHTELMAELASLHAALAALTRAPAGTTNAPPDAATARLKSELDLIAGAMSGGTIESAHVPGPSAPQTPPLARVAHELTEVVSSTERSTQKVLAAAEAIDQVANNLSAALNGKFEQGLAQDIQDLVLRIFEACNFQDLAGQRVSKVLATMNFVEAHIGRVLDEIKNPHHAARRDGTQYLHGPRLDIDRGHASQADIDDLFRR